MAALITALSGAPLALLALVIESKYTELRETNKALAACLAIAGAAIWIGLLYCTSLVLAPYWRVFLGI